MPLPAKNSVDRLMISRTVSISVVFRRTPRRGEAMARQGGEFLLVIRLLRRRDDRVDVALHDLRQVVEREADAMIRQPVLRKIVGANPLAAITGSNLAAPGRGV